MQEGEISEQALTVELAIYSMKRPEANVNGFLKYVQKRTSVAHLLVSENVNEVVEGERSRLQNQLPGVFRALPGENQKLVPGTVRDHQTNLQITRAFS